MFLPISLVVCGNGPMDTSCVRHFLRRPSSSRIFDSAFNSIAIFKKGNQNSLFFFFKWEIIARKSTILYTSSARFPIMMMMDRIRALFNELFMICTLIK